MELWSLGDRFLELRLLGSGLGPGSVWFGDVLPDSGFRVYGSGLGFGFQLLGS